MKAFIKLKLREINKSYEKMEKSRKAVLLFGIFSALSLMLTETFMFSSLDSYNKNKDVFAKLEIEKENLEKEKQTIMLKNAYKTEKSLLRKKEDLVKEIGELLKNDNGNYIVSEKVTELIGKIVEKTEELKMVSFSNIPSSKPEEKNIDVLIRHNFNLKVKGSFQGTYDLLNHLNQIGGLHISSINIEKLTEGVVSTSLELYVINTNKDILNF